MKNIEKQKVLSEIIENNYKCLIKPENPFSLDNPDAFVYKDHTLYAIFIPTFMEKENFDHLLRRLYISQLSCGTRFVPIMLWDEELPHSAFQCLTNSFAHITNNMQDFMGYIEKGEKDFRKWKDFSRLQQHHYINYRLCLDFSMFEHDRIMQEGDMDVRNSDEINFGVVRNMESWSEQGKAWYTTKYLRSQYGDLAQCYKKGNSGFEATFQKVMTMSFKNMYFFSDGRIEINRNALSWICVVDTDWNLFIENIFPNKYHHMLSFVGLTPVKMRSMNEIEYLSDKYRSLYEYVYRKKDR